MAFHLGREADHSPPSSAEAKNGRNCTFTSQYAFMAWRSVRGSTGTTLLLPVPNITLVVNERIILKWILKKQNVRICTGFMCLRIESSCGLMCT